MTGINGDGFSEKRKEERKYLVFYPRVFAGADSAMLGHVVNLSSAGFLLISSSLIRVEKQFRMRMRMPKEVCENPELELSATSCWCRKDLNPDFYLTGFKMANLNAAESMDIRFLLDGFNYKPA